MGCKKLDPDLLERTRTWIDGNLIFFVLIEDDVLLIDAAVLLGLSEIIACRPRRRWSANRIESRRNPNDRKRVQRISKEDSLMRIPVQLGLTWSNTIQSKIPTRSLSNKCNEFACPNITTDCRWKTTLMHHGTAATSTTLDTSRVLF